MKKLFSALFITLCLIIAGCGDNGTEPPPPEPGVARVIANTAVTPPTFSDVNEEVWSNVTGTNILVGSSSIYGVNGNIGRQNVHVKAIKVSDTLYLWARWKDASANIWGGYIEKSSYQNDWTMETYSGEDKLLLVFADATNGDEWADCASMCHATEHHTTGGGTVDVWKWLSTRTAPGFMAEDDYWHGSGSANDDELNDFVYKRNWHLMFQRPWWMHIDSTEFSGPYLYDEFADSIDFLLNWIPGHKLPGYKIDSTIHSSATRESRWDINAISKFDSAATSPAEYTWTVVMKRALNTNHSDDINMTNLDSVQVTLAATHNDYAHPEPTTPISHSGSKPFWLILKP